MRESIRTTRLFNFLSAVLAFLLWGGWAYHINSASSPQSGVVAALTQGTASFLITLFMVHAVTFLFHRFQKPFVKVILPAVLVNSVTGFCLVSVHTLMGTPRVFATILPALTVAFSFCIFTACKLLKLFQQQGNTSYE
ncbi:hypothetical protein Pan241w_43220 [Gimesia alba]|uniref:Uncharacterized protein n=1 Tax=Gimesia alba TaxID=2527973 RepID=A0A517RK36_9PLAN|nr:hypothetical protein [Gimesia alba]QDT44214.1 hypothetical protein Pan241w_43220 [Gimesia alba]